MRCKCLGCRTGQYCDIGRKERKEEYERLVGGYPNPIRIEPNTQFSRAAQRCLDHAGSGLELAKPLPTEQVGGSVFVETRKPHGDKWLYIGILRINFAQRTATIQITSWSHTESW